MSDGLFEELHGVVSVTPSAAELADLEQLLAGAFRPLRGFLGALDVAAVEAGGRLRDGTPWPSAVVLTVPEGVAGEKRIVLQDPETVPLAVLEVSEAWSDPSVPDGHFRVAGTLTALRESAYGAFRRLRRRPPAAGEDAAAVLAVATREPLHRARLGQIRQAAEKLGLPVLVLALLSGVHEQELVRALLAVRRELPEGAEIVTVNLAPRADAVRDQALAAHVAAAYGATHLLTDLPLEDVPLTLVAPEPWAYDTDLEVWRPRARVAEEHVRAELTAEELGALLDRGEEVPEWFTPRAVAAELRKARPPRHERGVTVFFTGLSGSGKSTVARALGDALIERGDRTVSLLDGDVVRQMLSSGLTFSKADRDLNIRRIGYVAAEITRHGGLAICAPIAPYAATRAEVRRMVEAVGDFVLVHVATPLEECERRDRKGLYAKARAGLIPEFTGISDPYETPGDAELVIDTTGRHVSECVDEVLKHLVAGGWLRPQPA
ncbi:adenylyl-sulfate kinase [Actinocorallia sp. A-T 12471]|uniref:adenylyl-sulfate kinase n=1 Tax=Actinocorallia sp. A-T 12471 TaxID=3089813 RepID=UPI0029CBC134|nr:adenylyl-sulfate kinase [Actinocorallia sp. A-T 12471]MDX6738521.1 adenylyl-sulfate kinase [Actinocorallia sp. A-T 12471]